MPDSNQIIGATIKVDTGASNQNVQELGKSLTGVKGTLKDVGATAATTSKQVGESGGSFGKLKEQMTALPGPLGAAGEGVNKLSSTFKALLANPVVLIIVAIVGALALLYKAFTNTFEGAEKVEQIFAGVKAAAQALFDDLGHIASAIAKFFTFDFSGAADEIKQVVDDVGKAYTAMSELTKKAQDLHKEQLQNDLEQAERQKRLAVLREEATDDTVPIAKRKAALIELKKDSEQNAKDDIDLAKRVTENKLAQLTLEKDGALKNRDEINKIKIEQINVETDAANELRRIGKQLTAADRAEKAEQKAAADKAKEEAKKRREELAEFTNKLAKIQQDNELAQISDTYLKEKKQLENKIADDKRANDLAFQDKKITRIQYDQLNAALDATLATQEAALKEKHNKEVAQKEADFQKELNTLTNKIKLDGLNDARAAEKFQLQITYEEKLADAIKAYKDDTVKFQAIKNALDAQLKADQDKLDLKFKQEDDKKKFAVKEQQEKAIAEDRKKSFTIRLQAVDDEQALVKKAFDDKVLTELEYNTKVTELANARKTIREEEQKHNEEVASAISKTFGNLADLAGRQTAAGKAFAIAQTTIDTYTGAIAAYKSLAGIPVVGPALGAIAAAAAVANGLKAVKTILAVPVPGQGTGGGAPSTTDLATSAPIAPTQSSTKLDQSAINGIGNATTGKVYVLSGDVANAADRDARLSRQARLGG